MLFNEEETQRTARKRLLLLTLSLSRMRAAILASILSQHQKWLTVS